MAARTFEDSAGTVWEVFEVRRTSQKALAVSAGLEQGWLAFVSGQAKRRLAPFPPEWQTADTVELERLCGTARVARATSLTVGPVLQSGIEQDVEATVRDFAHQARAHRLPAIEAMVRLKALLARTFPEPSSPARNVRAVRRWFVEAYYFDRDATPADGRDQSL